MRLVGQQQEDGSRMQQALTSLITNQRELNNYLESLQSQVKFLDASRNRWMGA